MKTAISFSFDPKTLAPSIALKGLDENSLENVIMDEEKKLKMMHLTFFDAITLFRLQNKLINALKHLLNLIAKPQTTLHALIQQLSKISALYFEIDNELAKAKRHKKEVSDEIQAQENKIQELVRLANAAYDSQKEKIKAYHSQQSQLSTHVLASKPQFNSVSRIKTLLENLYAWLGLNAAAHYFHLAVQRRIDDYCQKIIMERMNRRILHSLHLHNLKLKASQALRQRLRPAMRSKLKPHR